MVSLCFYCCLFIVSCFQGWLNKVKLSQIERLEASQKAWLGSGKFGSGIVFYIMSCRFTLLPVRYWEDVVLAGEEVDMLAIHAGAFIGLIIWGALVSLSTTLFLAGVGIATFPLMASQYATNKDMVDTIMQDIALPSIEELSRQVSERFGSE